MLILINRNRNKLSRNGKKILEPYAVASLIAYPVAGETVGVKVLRALQTALVLGLAVASVHAEERSTWIPSRSWLCCVFNTSVLIAVREKEGPSVLS